MPTTPAVHLEEGGIRPSAHLAVVVVVVSLHLEGAASPADRVVANNHPSSRRRRRALLSSSSLSTLLNSPRRENSTLSLEEMRRFGARFRF